MSASVFRDWEHGLARCGQQMLVLSFVGLLGWGVGGCSSWSEQRVAPLADPSGVNRRMQLWEVAEPTAKGEQVATRPADAGDPLAKPYRLNLNNIIQLAYEMSPLVTASREEMIAAQHGLTEFKANLSRLEPFVESTGDASRFPERRDSEGTGGEVVAGLEKETFDGAIFRVEGGLSGERVEFGEVQEDQEEVDEGNGGLIRGRIEVPFVGSRKRQERIISQAFQESNARKAVLSYLSKYRSYVDDALEYYLYTVYYLNCIRAYQTKLGRLNRLVRNPHVKPEDLSRIQSEAGETKVLLEQYQAYYGSYLLLLLQYLGIEPQDEYILEEPDDSPSPYLASARNEEGKLELLAAAYEHNPTFRVLADALEDSELQRSQAILGEYDITAFVEGTQFPFGAEMFDDRVGGWQLGAGVTVRLNDRRVLNATRKKAEAEIRQYRAQIEAEQLRLQRSIATQSDRLCSYYDSRPQIHENIKTNREDFAERAGIYLDGGPLPYTIDDVLAPLNKFTSAHLRLAENLRNAGLAETALMSATGDVYRLVGMEVNGAGGMKIPGYVPPE